MSHINCQKYPILQKISVDNNQFLYLFEAHPNESVSFKEIEGHEIMLCDEDMNIIWIISPEVGFTSDKTWQFEKNDLSKSSFFDLFEKKGQYYAIRYGGDCFLINMQNGLAEFDHWGKY